MLLLRGNFVKSKDIKNEKIFVFKHPADSRGWEDMGNEVVMDCCDWIRPLQRGEVMEQRLILDIDRRLV